MKKYTEKEIIEACQKHMTDIENQFPGAPTEDVEGNMKQAYVTTTHVYWRITGNDGEFLFNKESEIYQELLKEEE